MRISLEFHMTKTESAIAIFNNADAGALTFSDKKGNLHSITAEGALFKGGAALSALKDAALEGALLKAGNGKYRAASDVLCAAFPSIGKAAEKLIGTPWANKSSMATLIGAVLRAEPGKNGWTKKQADARLLVSALSQLPAFKVAASQGEVIEG
jgi:hypothetical protein